MRKHRKIVAQLILGISLIINLIFVLHWSLILFNAPEYRLGVLPSELKIWKRESGTKSILTLPQGLIVKNESPGGLASAGLFEPYVFSILISSSDSKIVDYSKKIERGAVYTTESQD
jgi:hypothetical protein